MAPSPVDTSSPPDRTVRYSALVLAGFALLLALAGCGSGATGGSAGNGGGGAATTKPAPPPPPPAAADLLNKAATAMAGIHSAAVELAVDPALSNLQIRSAHGTITSTGEATGSATINQGGGGAAVEFQFVIAKGSLYLKGATGGYQQLPLSLAASVYDPTALLSPDRGVPALLRTATNGVTEGEEDVNGTPTYRVRATLNPNLIGSIMPDLAGTRTGTVWLDKVTSRMVKAQLNVPTAPDKPNSATAPVTVTLSSFDAPVTINPPS